MMNRRKFLLGIPLLSGGVALSYGIFKWISLKSSPDLDYLKSKKSLLAALVDTIIPPTDSPSASACGVHEFIITTMVKNSVDIKTQNKFVDGLKEVEAYTASQFTTTFDQLDQQSRTLVLQHFAGNSERSNSKLARLQALIMGSPFYMTLRTYCIIGYFTSEGGATQALRYAHVPTAYIACEPYATSEKAWATR